MAQHGQDNDRANDVVADVGDTVDSPAVDLRMSGEGARNTIAEGDQGDHDEDRVDPVEEVRNVAEQPLDCVISESHDSGNRRHENSRAEPPRCSEDRPSNLPRGRAVDRQDEHDEENVR